MLLKVRQRDPLDEIIDLALVLAVLSMIHDVLEQSAVALLGMEHVVLSVRDGLDHGFDLLSGQPVVKITELEHGGVQGARLVRNLNAYHLVDFFQVLVVEVKDVIVSVSQEELRKVLDLHDRARMELAV